MNELTILDEIQHSSDLLSLPQSLSEILGEMEKPDFSAEQLANIILKDPALTGRILKLANSSFYHRFSRITTVHQAVQLLGVVTVKCLALSSSVFHPAKVKKDSGVDPRDYFSKVLTVAAAAEKIAQKTGYKAPEEAFIAGLLHDVGTMFFLHHYPDRYRMVFSGTTAAGNLLDAEKEVFNTTHTEVGYHLASRWRLPKQLTEAIRSHHMLTHPDDPDLSNILRLATLIATGNDSLYGEDIEGRMSRIRQAADCLGLTNEDIDAISISLLSWTVSVAEYLGIDIGNIEDMLARANQEIWRTYLIVENLFKERQELTRRLLEEERAKGAIESRNVAMATLSHYINNATMAIYGRSQLLRMKLDKNDVDGLLEKLPEALDVIDRSIKKTVAVLAEIKDISVLDEVNLSSTSRAMNIDDRVATRLESLENDHGLVMPFEVESALDDPK
jgi:two-component system cell cycle response regulator